ncbi:MAG TPA: hypothetical protein H9751_07370 [Candidatus Corynebacterium faecigallinarum]|uniref:Uncharacterized protein n=1 Tax=Candidatus Corynebacterium faecigallinarum TaxID=2838528 RepID=A0A9D2TP44_9CORY|nr:hypothetical protein [Candidatus Corynebacterium faecigallinarum]
MSDSVFPALMAVLIGVAASAVLFIPFVTLSYRRRGRPGGGQDAAVGRGADLLLGDLVVPRRHRGMAPPQDAGEPRPVTRGGRLLAMLCDWLGFTLVSVSVPVSVQLVPGIGWVSWLFAVVCIVLVFVTQQGRDLPGLVSGQELVDARQR